MSQVPGGPSPSVGDERTDGWWKVLLIGGVLYVLGVGILAVTGNSNLFPTVIMLGSFLVPAAYVVFFYQRRHLCCLDPATTAMAFFYGGVLGVFAASILEPLFISQLDFGTAFLVGLIEEAAKILGVLVIARHRRHDLEIDGFVLGAAAGMGFAALESAGYAFTAFLDSQGSLSMTVATVLVRGLLAPLGHGTWTAILAAVLFREGTVRHFRITMKVAGTYLLVSGLHGLWDGLPAVFALFLPTGPDAIVSQLLVGGTSLYLLRVRWLDAVQRQRATTEAAEIAPAGQVATVEEQEAAREEQEAPREE